MVTVTAKGLCLEVTGHAGWAPRGSDLVCAGVSVLTATLAAAMTALWEQGRLNTQPEIAMGAGKDWQLWEEHLLGIMGRCTDYYERLPLVQDKQILDNILYSGIWVNYRRKRKEETV